MCKWVKNLFKKKVVLEDNTVVPTLDVDKYKIRLNVRTMCVYEQLSNKSFLKIGNEEDVMKVLYASLIVNNNEFRNMTFKTFQYLIKDERVLKWMVTEYDKVSKFIWQFKKDEETVGEAKEEDIPMVTDIASTFIVKLKIDPMYVYYNMELWEIYHYMETMYENYKQDVTEKRLFTYVQMLPMIDSKKVKGPEKILPFPWEKESDRNKTFEDNAQAALNFLSHNKEEEIEEDNG